MDANTASSPTTHNNVLHSRTQDEHRALNSLESALEQHFQALKREYEAKRGKAWTPLRPWTGEHSMCESESEWTEDDDDISMSRTAESQG
ncbi:hypothetical protein ACJQWK_10974 [Exserohilum turcicum]